MTEKLKACPEPSNADYGDTLDSVRDYIHYLECRIEELETRPTETAVGGEKPVKVSVQGLADIVMADVVAGRRPNMLALKSIIEAAPQQPDKTVLKGVRDALETLECDIEQQTHFEIKKLDFNPHPDDEFDVILRHSQIKSLSQQISALDRLMKWEG